jgi:hypothetical protein
MKKVSIQGTNSNFFNQLERTDFQGILNKLVNSKKPLSKREIENITEMQCPYLMDQLKLKLKK